MADDSLTAIFPALPMTLGGERVRLRPVVLGEIPALSRVLEAWGSYVKRAGQHLDMEAWADFLDLLSGAAGLPLAWVKALDEGEFTRLVSMAIALNHEVFEPATGGGESLPWALLAQRLVGHGHRWEDVQNYTLAQSRAFLDATVKEDNETLASQIVAASFSMADPKHTKSTIMELRRG